MSLETPLTIPASSMISGEEGEDQSTDIVNCVFTEFCTMNEI